MRRLGVKGPMKVIQKDVKLGLELVLFGFAGTVKGVLVNICTQTVGNAFGLVTSVNSSIKCNCCLFQRVTNVFGLINSVTVSVSIGTRYSSVGRRTSEMAIIHRKMSDV